MCVCDCVHEHAREHISLCVSANIIHYVCIRVCLCADLCKPSSTARLLDLLYLFTSRVKLQTLVIRYQSDRGEGERRTRKGKSKEN